MKNKKTKENKKEKIKRVRPIRREKSRLAKFFSTVFWLAFIAFAVVTFLYTFNLTHDFVMDRANVDIAALVGDIPEDEAIKIDIPWGADTVQINEILIDKGILSGKKIFNKWYEFELYSVLMGNDGGYKSGVHLLNKNIDYDNPIGFDMLIYIFSQNPVPNPTAKIFFQEGLTFKQTVDKFVANGFVSEEDFIKTCNTYDFDYDFVKQIPKNTDRKYLLEGYLFPDTYIFDITKEPKDAIIKMLDNFNNKFKDVYVKRAEKMGMSIDDIIIIASLIEKEAKLDEDRGAIAGVIYNRLNSHDSSLQRLQIDATIQYYFLNTTGKVKEELLTEDTKIDTPYNTYLYAGLPPGPICNPGEKSIIAALYPDENDYYYYVAKKDGSHAYASTLQEHNNNVIKYSK